LKLRRAVDLLAWLTGAAALVVALAAWRAAGQDPLSSEPNFSKLRAMLGVALAAWVVATFAETAVRYVRRLRTDRAQPTWPALHSVVLVVLAWALSIAAELYDALSLLRLSALGKVAIVSRHFVEVVAQALYTVRLAAPLQRRNAGLLVL
jgi:uncharacterized membrane protein YidH (DUF202 family)